MNLDLISYYSDRAKEYEKVYLKPERQLDLQKATTVLQSIFSQKTVLEIACGTGYWTERIAQTATSIYATDISQSVIEVARSKHYPIKVTFEVCDMYSCKPGGKYESVFGGFIWSHIPLQDLDKFIDNINGFVAPGGLIVLMDNNYVEGSNHPITETDGQGNTYQIRKLENETSHLVLKNFPTKEFIMDKFSTIASAVDFLKLTYYWIASFRLTGNKRDNEANA
jgi:2-polyprenyl-3-methyl-5-hydroxy-6-metoxy-1,4-benzoquinol methylase